MRALLRAAPWRALVGLATVGSVLGVLGFAVGGATGVRCLQLMLVLLGGAAACSLDDAAASVVAACPVPHWRRVAARSAPVLAQVLVAAGWLSLWALRSEVDARLALELVGCAALGFGAALVARQWLDEPGDLVASSLILALVGVLLIDPLDRALALFALEGHPHRTWLSWGVVLVASALALTAGVPEHRWHRCSHSAT
jgi:hypothetical protein